MDEDWMSTGEIAKELGVSSRTVRLILEEDAVQVLRLNKKIRVRRSDFNDLFERRYRPYSPQVDSK